MTSETGGFGTTVEEGWVAYEEAVLPIFQGHPHYDLIREACRKAFHAGNLHSVFLVFRGLGVEVEKEEGKTVIAYNLNDLAKAIEHAARVQGEVHVFAASLDRSGATIN